jgi:hypothetical protein
MRQGQHVLQRRRWQDHLPIDGGLWRRVQRHWWWQWKRGGLLRHHGREPDTTLSSPSTTTWPRPHPSTPPRLWRFSLVIIVRQESLLLHHIGRHAILLIIAILLIFHVGVRCEVIVILIGLEVAHLPCRPPSSCSQVRKALHKSAGRYMMSYRSACERRGMRRRRWHRHPGVVEVPTARQQDGGCRNRSACA